MKINWRIFLVVCILVMSSEPMGHAAKGSQLPPNFPMISAEEIMDLHERVETYFAGREPDLAAFADLKPNLYYLRFVLKVIRVRMTERAVSARILRLAGELLRLIAGKVREARSLDRSTLNGTLQHQFHDQLHPLLKRYCWDQAIRKPLVAIYDDLYLWSPGDIDIALEVLNGPEERLFVWQRLYRLLPYLNDRQTRQMREALERRHPSDLVGLSFVVEAESMLNSELFTQVDARVEAEVTRMFLAFYEEFTQALVTSRRLTPKYYGERRKSDGRELFLQQELIALRQYLQAGYVNVIKGFENAKAKAAWLGRRDRRHEDGLIFFELFEQDLLSWLDPLSWSLSEIKEADPAPRLLEKKFEPSTRPKALVYYVDFSRRSCTEELTSEKSATPSESENK